MNFSAVLLIALVALPAACSARALRGLEVVAAPNGTQAETRGLDEVLEYVETAVEVAADAVAGLWGGGVCLYGNNCGMNCEHSSYDEDDALDKACYEHDQCLKLGEEDVCDCDDKLIRDAAEIADWDDGSDMVRTAATVRDGMMDYGKAYHGCWSE